MPCKYSVYCFNCLGYSFLKKEMKRSFDVLVKVTVFSAYAGPSAIYIMQKAQLLCIFVGATAFWRRVHEISPPPRDFPSIALFLSRPVNIGYPLVSLWKYFLSLLIITWHSTTVLLSQSRQPRRKVRFRYFVVVFRPGVQCCDPCD